MPTSIFGRRKFLQYSALSLGGLFVKVPASAPKLAFSTLGCPDWDLPEIISFARQHGYSGLEFRGIKADMFLPDSPWFSKGKMGATRRMMADAGLQPVGLGSSAQLHHTEEAAAGKHLDEARKYIDLAAELGCRNVRVFPEKLPLGTERRATLDLIASRMQQLADYARPGKVNILVESHGDLVASDDLQYVLGNVKAPNAGMIWDVVNMWVVTKEAPAVVYPKLRPYIRHVHLKDIMYEGDKFRYVLFGKGQAPVKEAMTLLNKGKYNGYYSFEWEKRWHPEIEAPELALAAYPEAFRQYAK